MTMCQHYDDVYYDDVYYNDVYYSDVYHDDVYYEDVYYDDVYDVYYIFFMSCTLPKKPDFSEPLMGLIN